MSTNIHAIAILVILTTFLYSCSKLEKNTENALPVAKLVVTPSVGDTSSQMLFDASLSADREDSAALTFAWIFGDEKDQYPDTMLFSSDRFATHQYNQKGYFRAKVLVRDSQGLIDSAIHYVNIVSDLGNSAPGIPVYSNPADSSVNQLTTVYFEWGCNDPENDFLTYDLYLGDKADPAIFARNLVQASYNVSGLQYNTTYYWRIGVFDEAGNYVLGPVWSFTTEN